MPRLTQPLGSTWAFNPTLWLRRPALHLCAPSFPFPGAPGWPEDPPQFMNPGLLSRMTLYGQILKMNMGGNHKAGWRNRHNDSRSDGKPISSRLITC